VTSRCPVAFAALRMPVRHSVGVDLVSTRTLHWSTSGRYEIDPYGISC
jgi:hypothetical protein